MAGSSCRSPSAFTLRLYGSAQHAMYSSHVRHAAGMPHTRRTSIPEFHLAMIYMSQHGLVSFEGSPSRQDEHLKSCRSIVLDPKTWQWSTSCAVRACTGWRTVPVGDACTARRTWKVSRTLKNRTHMHSSPVPHSHAMRTLCHHARTFIYVHAMTRA